MFHRILKAFAGCFNGELSKLPPVSHVQLPVEASDGFLNAEAGVGGGQDPT
jgi:hypothetical protein